MIMQFFRGKPTATDLVLAVPAAAAPLVAYFAPRGIAVLVIATAVAVVALAVRDRRRPDFFSRPVLIVLSLLVLWSLISAAWAPDAWLAARGALKLAGSALAGALVISFAAQRGPESARLVGGALAVGVIVAFVFMAIDVAFRDPISALFRNTRPAVQWYGHYWLNPCAAVLSLLIWPVAFLAWRRWGGIAAMALVGCVAAMDVAIGYSTAAGALFIGAVGAGLAFRWGRGTAIAIAVAFAAVMFAAPVISGKIVGPPTIAEAPIKVRQILIHRLYIWRFAAERIAEHPWRGWGMNASRSIPGGKDHAFDSWRGDVGENLPLHPHNLMLQVWLELGLPGVVLFVVLGGLVLVPLAGSTIGRSTAAVRIGLACTALSVFSASYSTWSSWWLAALWLAAAMAAAITDPPDEDASHGDPPARRLGD
jgi:exopolysaccharide production protein ExoQ